MYHHCAMATFSAGTSKYVFSVYTSDFKASQEMRVLVVFESTKVFLTKQKVGTGEEGWEKNLLTKIKGGEKAVKKSKQEKRVETEGG